MTLGFSAFFSAKSHNVTKYRLSTPLPSAIQNYNNTKKNEFSFGILLTYSYLCHGKTLSNENYGSKIRR